MRKQPAHLEVITAEEVEQIHRTSLRILAEIGVRFPSNAMLDRLEAIGVLVDRDRQVARFPETVVEKVLRDVPKDFAATPPDGGSPVAYGDGELKLSFDQTPFIVDYMTGSMGRQPTDEILRGIAVSNALENVRQATGYCLPNDVPDMAGDVVSFRLLWTYSRKPVANWIYSPEGARAILDMALTVAGGEDELRQKKLLSYFAEPVSPLRWARHSLEIILSLSRYACPIHLGPMVTAGGSGPVTLAGTLALHNAEMLQGITTIAACNPRQPVVYSCHAHRLDLKRAAIMYGAPEQALLAAGATQLAKRYGLPAAGNVMLSDSNVPDYMAGFEAGATAAYALAAGWEMLGLCGFGTIGVVGAGVGLSLEHAIVQDEALGYLKRMLRSFDVNDETLAWDVIREAGIGGIFTGTEHTIRHMRTDLWEDKGIFKPLDYETWARNGSETVLDRAHRRLQEILDDSMPLEPVIDAAETAELQRIETAYINSLASP